jgi:CubicO group peptidase (beta-lactamase class C family)
VLIARFASLNLPLEFAPGSRYSYTNSDYVLLGEIIEAVSGQAYGDYLRQYITGPLGLSTAYATKLPAGLAKGYQETANSLESAGYLDPTYIYAAGGIVSSASDLLIWQKALVEGRVVRPESYTEMTTPGTLTNGEAITYGYGLMIATRNGHKAIFHEGAIDGYLSILVYYPGQDLAIVLLANTIPAAFLSPLQALEAHITALILLAP